MTPEELKSLPVGTEVESVLVLGSTKIVGVNLDVNKVDSNLTVFGIYTYYGISNFEEKIKTNPDIFLFALK